MPLEAINVGFGNVVIAHRVVAVVGTNSSPIRRMIEAAERQNRLIDATGGRRTRSAIITDSNHIILCHIHPATVAQKLRGIEVEEESVE